MRPTREVNTSVIEEFVCLLYGINGRNGVNAAGHIKLLSLAYCGKKDKLKNLKKRNCALCCLHVPIHWHRKLKEHR